MSGPPIVNRQPSIVNRLIVALDVDGGQRALELVDLLQGKAGYFKIGSRLFTAEGPSLVREIVARGQRVFLDLKFHDIPDVVAGAAIAAGRLGVSILTVHALGGGSMMSYCHEKLQRGARSEGWACPLVAAVTILTSLDEQALGRTGIDRSLDEMVVHLATTAQSAGLPAIVASAREVTALRRRGLTKLAVITPGIRPGWAGADDQRRVLTPLEALQHGADYLVIGRPITAAPDPVEATARILSEMADYKKF